MSTIYVDELKVYGSWQYGKSCHLFPSSRSAQALPAFHRFAESIGMRREWFQSGGWPHYDLTSSRRIAAVKAGAVELTTREYIKYIRTMEGSSDFPEALPRMADIMEAYSLRRMRPKTTRTKKT